MNDAPPVDAGYRYNDSRGTTSTGRIAPVRL